MLALDDEIQVLWKKLEQMSDANEYRERAREYREKARAIEEQIKGYRSELAGNIKAVNEESARYISAVSVIGYAAYFATWGLVKDNLGREMTSFVGLMGMISVSLFVLWEIYVILAVRLKAVGELGHIFQNMVSVEDFEPMRLRQVERDAKRILALTVAHRVVFTVSILSACAGGAAMMQALYCSL